MKFKGRKFWIWATAVTTVVLVMLLAMGRVPGVPPQIVTLPDGKQYQVLTATWGTRHSQPRLVAKMIDHLPFNVAAFLRRHLVSLCGNLAPMPTSEPSMCFWLKAVDPALTNFMGTTRTINANVRDSQGNGNWFPWISMTTIGPFAVIHDFKVVPRRDPTIVLHVFSTDGPDLDLTFSNPFYRRYPEWKPEPLPATKQVDGFSLTMTGISVIQPEDPLAPHQSRIAFSMSAPSNEVWMPHTIELEDATGNRIAPKGGRTLEGMELGFIATAPDALIYPKDDYPAEGTLFPSEKAWRVRFLMKKVIGYSKEEIVTFTNVTLPVANATNGIMLTQWVAGVPVVLRNYSLIRSMLVGLSGTVSGQAPLVVDYEEPDASSGLAVDCLEVTTDTGRRLSVDASGYFTYNSIRYRSLPITFIPSDAHSLTVKLVVQKLRTFDFYVKPPGSTNR